MTSQQDKGKYVLLGKGVEEICSRTDNDKVLGPVSRILACQIRQFQDPQVSPDEWRNSLVLCKYDIYDSEQTHHVVPSSAVQHPKQAMAFGLGSFKIVVQTINNYVTKLLSHLARCNIAPSMAKTPAQWTKLALAVEKYLCETAGLVVGQSIPGTLEEIEKMKNCTLPPPTKTGQSNTKKNTIFWTVISQFPHPLTKKQTCKDEMYGILVRTSQWGKPNTDKLEWFGIKVVMQRQDTAQKELFKENSLLVLQSQETLALLKYLTQPFTQIGSQTLISQEWPELLNDVVKEKLMKKSADLDSLNETHSLQETSSDCCTYLGDAQETGNYSPKPLPLINYAEEYADSADGGASNNFITPPKQQRLSITAVSAPSKKSNKVKFTTPTGEQRNFDDSSPPDDDTNYDNDIFTQQTPSRKRPAPATDTSIKRATKRRKTAANNVIITALPPPEMLSDEDNNNDDAASHVGDGFDDSINEDELDKIIG